MGPLTARGKQGRLASANAPPCRVTDRASTWQRRSPSAIAINSAAARLPFDDKQFDAAVAILMLYHWPDKAAGIREMRRVAKGPVVLLTYDPAHRLWHTDYLPALASLDEARLPSMEEYAKWLGPVDIQTVNVPHDCTDGFLYAYWRRPAAYLDARLRRGSSDFWTLGGADLGLIRLRSDIESGEWARRYAGLLTRDAYDAGYRLVVANA